MALLITDEQVKSLVSMPDAIDTVEDAFRQLAAGRAFNNPRSRIKLNGEMLHVLSAALPDRDALGLKSYTAFRAGIRFLLVLYSAKTGELKALIEANRLSQLRTGASAGVACRHLARSDSRQAVVFGTGTVGRGAVEALAAAGSIERITAYGRDPERLAKFCATMSAQIGVDVVPASTPDEAVSAADIVVTATTAKDPVFDGKLLRPGTTVIALGSNLLQKREIDGTVIRRAQRIVVDSIEQCQLEAGDLFVPIDAGFLHWNQVEEIGNVILGRVPGRSDTEEINLFKSVGLGVQDVALGALIHERALAAGIGTELPL